MKSTRPEPSHIHLNLTAMLDVVFNLIFFFISICNMAGNELPKLTVPSPDSSQARLIEARKKVTVNVLPDGTSGMARAVKIGSDEVVPGDYIRIVDLLKTEKAINPDVEIDLRVDLTLFYDSVRPVMNAITQAGISKINLVANIDAEAKL